MQARMDSGISEPRTAVIVYVAQLTPRLPMQRTVVSLLKEYLPVARAVAYNELLVMHQLTGLPEDKHMVGYIPQLRHGCCRLPQQGAT